MTRSDLQGRLEEVGLAPELARAYLLALEEGIEAVAPADRAVLVEVGLADGRDGPRLHPPEAVMARWAHRHELDARRLRDLGGPLQSLYRVSGADTEPPVQVLRTVETVRDTFLEVQRSATARVRAMDRGPYRPGRAKGPSTVQTAALAAGVTYSVIYASEVVRSEAFRSEIAECVRAGEEARVLPEVPMKMVIADEEVALVIRLTPAGMVEGFLVRPSLLLDTLMGFFATLWDLAIPVRPGGDEEDDGEELVILRSLAMGLTDDAIARELGVSERTVARRIARLQQTMATRSRFQLGLQAARRGLI